MLSKSMFREPDLIASATHPEFPFVETSKIIPSRAARGKSVRTISFDLFAPLLRFAGLTLFWCIPIVIFEGPGINVVILCESK